jgi:protein O-GlcNAc transferase
MITPDANAVWRDEMSNVDNRQTLHRALQLHQAGKPGEAAPLYRQLLARQPDNAMALHYLGIAEAGAGSVDQAKLLMARSLQIEPANISFIENYATVLCQSGDNISALQICDRGFQLDGANVVLLYASAVALCKLRRFQESLAQFDKLLRFKPDHIAALTERGAVLAQLNRHDAALVDFQNTLKLQPLYAEAFLNLGNLYGAQQRYNEAFTAYDRALALKPALADAWLGRGNLLFNLKRCSESAAAYDRALALQPSLAGAWLGRGNVLSELNRLDEAITAYDKAFTIEPDLPFVEGSLLEAKLHCCDWSNFDAERGHLVASVKNLVPAPPFAFLAISTSPAEQLLCAKLCTKSKHPPSVHPVWTGERYSHDRIRLGYFSADFCEHATAYLAAGLFESHDRSRFEVTGISFGPDLNSPLRKRIKGAFERFIDVHDKSDHDVADLVRGLEIDIAVDLMGFTKNNRLNVFARRPAPIQVNYLGYIGTMGADFIDYVIADKIALPHDQQAFFTEKIVHLPDCFLVTDDQQEIAPDTPSREEEGLPPEGFVFCSFNNSYKLGRSMFEVWMRLLHRVQGSVLWLAEGNPEMVVNLRREARQCGIEPERIVFAPRVGLPRHLGRQRLAGLFLDSTPYNAGATGAAALWAGVPLVTVVGETFVGRMAASMLHTAGLPELAVHSLGEYEAFALKFACDPAFRSNIQRKLQDNLRTTPLFDTDRFRRNIEQAYATMIDILRRGESPRSFAVETT